MKPKKKPSQSSQDLRDSSDDKKHLQPDEGTLDLPDVRDIPGQEHIQVPKMKEFADTTISSDDEEGVDVFGDGDEFAGDTNVSKDERRALQDPLEKSGNVIDDENLAEAQLDDADEDGDLLNERDDVSGSDLDIPGSDNDDGDEELGEEDEENNSYSMDGEDEDDSASKQ